MTIKNKPRLPVKPRRRKKAEAKRKAKPIKARRPSNKNPHEMVSYVIK
jgi:hypothetical protein